MISLLGSLLGFGTSFLPKIMDYFQDKQDKKHELLIMERQTEHAKAMKEIDLIGVGIEADIKEIEAVHDHDFRSNIRWLDGLRASVRPVVTYFFFGLFVFVEVSAYILLLDSGVGALEASQTIWDDKTHALFASVLSFWFGSRVIEKFSRRA